MVKDLDERLFRFDNGFIHVQRLHDDPEYDTDYTIYDSSFRDIDGGVLDDGYEHTLREIAVDVLKGSLDILKRYGLKYTWIQEADLSKYLDEYDFR